MSHRRWRYGPNGEARIIEAGEADPEGWADTPTAFEVPEPAVFVGGAGGGGSGDDVVINVSKKPGRPKKAA